VTPQQCVGAPASNEIGASPSAIPLSSLNDDRIQSSLEDGRHRTLTVHLVVTLDVLRPIRTVTSDAALAKRAVEAHFLYGIPSVRWNDHRGSGKGIVQTNPIMNAGQAYFGVVVENPFAP
jgi:hypothetical protein